MAILWERAWQIVVRAAFSTLVFALLLVAQPERRLVTQAAPVYPAVARQMHLSGTVKIKAVIAADGRVTEVKVVGGHPLLAEATLEALKGWRYSSSNLDTPITLEFHFEP